MTVNDSDASPPSDSGDAQIASESDIQRLLDEATGLTQRIEHQVGANIEPPVAADTPSPTGVADVESQLDRVEEILRHVHEFEPVSDSSAAAPSSSGEPGTAPSSKRDPNSPPDTDSANATAATPPPSDAVPPAPLKSLRLDESVDPQAADRAAIDDSRQTAGLDSTLMHGESGAESSPHGGEDPTPGQFDPASEVPPAGSESRPAPPREQRPSTSRKIVDSCETTAFTLADALVRGLDRVDAPFIWMTADLRRIVGWAALAILVASVSIAAYSLS